MAISKQIRTIGLVLSDYWLLVLIGFYLIIFLSFPTINYKYSVAAPGFSMRGVDTFVEDNESKTLEFNKNGKHYKFVGTYEIRTN